MLNEIKEIKVEIDKLIQDATFVRNLSLTLIVAIASCCGLSELPSQNIAGNPEALIASIAYGNSLAHADMIKLIIKN